MKSATNSLDSRVFQHGTLCTACLCSSLLPGIELSSVESSLLVGAPLEKPIHPASSEYFCAQSSKHLFPKTPIIDTNTSPQGPQHKTQGLDTAVVMVFRPQPSQLRSLVPSPQSSGNMYVRMDTLGHNKPNTTYASLPWFHTIGFGLSHSPPTPTGAGLERPSSSVWATQLTTDSQCSRSL